METCKKTLKRNIYLCIFLELKSKKKWRGSRYKDLPLARVGDDEWNKQIRYHFTSEWHVCYKLNITSNCYMCESIYASEKAKTDSIFKKFDMTWCIANMSSKYVPIADQYKYLNRNNAMEHDWKN